MWQEKVKDIDLIFIAIQALIPTLKTKKNNAGSNNFDNIYTIIGKFDAKNVSNNNTISATSISEISGIPRATCIRKLDKLVSLGMLVRETKSKRYHVNQNSSERSKHILKKENVYETVCIFSDFLSIVLSSLVKNK